MLRSHLGFPGGHSGCEVLPHPRPCTLGTGGPPGPLLSGFSVPASVPGLRLRSLPGPPCPSQRPRVKDRCYTPRAESAVCTQLPLSQAHRRAAPSSPATGLSPLSLGSPLQPAHGCFTPSRGSVHHICIPVPIQRLNTLSSKVKISSFLQGNGRAEATDPLLTYCPQCPRGEDGEPGNHTRFARGEEAGSEFLSKFFIPARERLPGPI